MKVWKITYSNDKGWYEAGKNIRHYFIKARNKGKAILKFQRKKWCTCYVANIEEVK